MSSRAAPWPYPRWVAHRGAGKLAPENTLAAFRLGARFGYRMFECDVKLSADGVPFLLHDANLARTTDIAATNDARGGDAGLSNTAGNNTWADLATLDAGRWHSRNYAGEPLPSLAHIASFCLHNGFFLNIEIKPTPGTERHTGEVVAEHAARLWRTANAPPLMTSFDPEALAGAMAKAPALPRGLLLDAPHPDWLKVASELGCQAMVCNQAMWNLDTVAQAKAAGLRTSSYTVNDDWAAQRLIALGTDSIITDRVDFFSPGG